MGYVTHNQETITHGADTNVRGCVKAGYGELVALFGAPIATAKDRSHLAWSVRFSDGTTSVVFNASRDGTLETAKKIKEWFVAGESQACVDQVQIALDLYREQKNAPKDKAEEAFRIATDMIDTVKAAKGKGFALTVETAILCRKSSDILFFLLSGLIAADRISREEADKIANVQSSVSARLIALCAEAGRIDSDGEKGAREIMEWADRVIACEKVALDEIFKEAGRD